MLRWQGYTARMPSPTDRSPGGVLPHELPRYRIIYRYFMLWKRDGAFGRLLNELRSDPSMNLYFP